MSFQFTALSAAEADKRARGVVSVVSDKVLSKSADRKQREDETLTVEILSATELPQANLLTDQDTYVVASILPQKTNTKRTNVCEAGGTVPKWTSEHRNMLMLRVNGHSTALKLTVFATATLGEDVPIGSLSLDLSDIPYLRFIEHEMKLVSATKEQDGEAGAMDGMLAWATELVIADAAGSLHFKVYRKANTVRALCFRQGTSTGIVIRIR